MSYLTHIPGYPDSGDVRAGMAHFEGTGPINKTCGDCTHHGYYRTGKSKFNPRTGLIEERGYQSSGCRMFLKLALRHGPPVNGEWRACKYYTPADRR